MSDRLLCTGTLLLHDVLMNDGRRAVLLACTDCGELFVGGAPPDDRHHDAVVLDVN